MFFYIFLVLVIIAFDLVTKHLAFSLLPSGVVLSVIPDILSFTCVRNEGAAFGILDGARVFFIVLTVIVAVWAFIYIYKTRPKSLLEKLSLSFLIGGGLGNFIDRLFLGYVRDFIMVDFIDFPVFNIADCFVCIGAGLYILFAFSDIFSKKGTDTADE